MIQQFDLRNADIKIFVGNRLVHRKEAMVSVFDSVVQGGDAVSEGFRVYHGNLFCIEKHLQRLRESAHALVFNEVPSAAVLKQAVHETLFANNMWHDVYVRITLTRGEKISCGMDPRLSTTGCTLIVLAEWKPAATESMIPISIITSSVRRLSPQFLDSKIHHNNLLNNILAKIEANVAGVDAALMLDERGFLSELNDANIFLVKSGRLYTPFAGSCRNGITRGLVIDMARELNIPVEERNLSLTELYTAHEAFATGSIDEIIPIGKADGRLIGNEYGGKKILQKLQEKFAIMHDAMAEPALLND